MAPKHTKTLDQSGKDTIIAGAIRSRIYAGWIRLEERCVTNDDSAVAVDKKINFLGGTMVLVVRVVRTCALPTHVEAHQYLENSSASALPFSLKCLENL